MRSVMVTLLFVMVPVCAMAQSVDGLVVITEEFPPYNYIEKGRLVGSSVEIVVQILNRLGSHVAREDILVMPWARGYAMALYDRNTILFSTYRSTEREHLFKWVCPLSSTTIGLIARKDEHIIIQSSEDMEKYRIGVVREDIAHQELRKVLPEKDLDVLSASEHNFRMLQEGRLDLFAYDISQAEYVLRKIGLEPNDYEVVYVLLEEEGKSCIAFNKETDDQIVAAFQRELDRIRAENSIAK